MKVILNTERHLRDLKDFALYASALIESGVPKEVMSKLISEGKSSWTSSTPMGPVTTTYTLVEAD